MIGKKVIAILGSSLVVVVGGFYGLRTWYLRSGSSLVKQGAPTFARGKERLKLAHKLGSDQAAYNLGMAYWDGTGVEKDFTEAMKWLMPAADAGHTDALVAVGNALRLGAGVEKDEKKAQAYIRKAADEGQPRAMGLLAHDLLVGAHGESKNPTEALSLAQRGAEKGDAFSQLIFGKMLISNVSPENALAKGIQGGPSDGLKWIEKAADAGNTEACYIIGAAYVAMPTNHVPPFLASVLASNNNYPTDFGSAAGTTAALNPDGKYLVRDLKKAKAFLLSAAKDISQGPGELLVRKLYQEPSINPQVDQAEKRKMLEQLVEAGDGFSAMWLGMAYLNGDPEVGITKDSKEAMRLLQIANLRGDGQAAKVLEILERAAVAQNTPIQVERLGIYAPDGYPRIQGLVKNKTNVPHNARITIDLLQPNGTLIENYSKTFFGIQPGQAAAIDISIAPYHRNAQVRVRNVEWQ